MLGFNEADLELIRGELGGLMSEFRLNHVLAVEAMASRIGSLFFTDEESLLIIRAAALFHDITKELDTKEHIEIANGFGEPFGELELCAPKTLHAKTAAMAVAQKYPRFAHPLVLSAVSRHSTGCGEMNLIDKILFLSDYIDESRKYPDCVRLRGVFFDAPLEKMSRDEREEHLDGVLLEAVELIIKELLDGGSVIAPDTVMARNAIIIARAQR